MHPRPPRTRRPKPGAPASPKPTAAAAAPPDPAQLPVVGIGASAGGLEALEQFLAQIPPGSGIAFVVVQHLDPNHRGMLPELLRRATPMPVVQARDRVQVRPDCVYVIPPNRDLSLVRGTLRLQKPSAPRGLRLPIDSFFQSLALDLHERSIGVVLSGMGSDGTAGARAIKEQAGLVLVQEPGSARFDSMPQSVIGAGLADVVAPVGELHAAIIAHVHRQPIFVPDPAAEQGPARNALDLTIRLLRTRTGQDFSLYKRNTLHRRIERRMGIHKLQSPAAYVRFLEKNPQEVDLLFKELLIGVTRFFRDPPAWQQLGTQVFPALLKAHDPQRPLRAWVPACSTGEEAFSLAIAFREAAALADPQGTVGLQIFATDLDRDSIEKARQGLFHENIKEDVSAERLTRFFTREKQGYRIHKSIREMVIFAPQNLIMDPPFTRLDLLSCRNLLIYLAPEVQKKLIPLFHYSLAPGGILFLGIAETIGNFTDLFAPLAPKSRLLRKIEQMSRPGLIEFPPSFNAPNPSPHKPPRPAHPVASLQSLADHAILQKHTPPAVLATEEGDILYISGKTGKYLEPAAGKANWNLFAMAREGLRYELTEAFTKAVRSREAVTLPGLRVAIDGRECGVDVTLECLQDEGPLHGLMLLVFRDVPLAPSAPSTNTSTTQRSGSARSTRLELELQRARSEARATREAMQNTQEELRSANEELQSTNEELQSANEELTTSKEEMQSMNEELQTLNTELQAKVDDLSRASNDMKNLLDSTDIATLFLDRDLRVRRFTAQATTFVKLIPGDVGRPITDLVLDLGYPSLEHDVRKVLRTLLSVEKLASARDGRWFNVRILPYRTMDERIDGVVITFADVTTAKVLELKLRAQQAHLEKRVANHAPQKVSTPLPRLPAPPAPKSKSPRRRRAS